MLCTAVVSSIMVALTIAASVPGRSSPGPSNWTSTSCLTDSQANSLAEQFRLVLANTDRAAAIALAEALVVESFTDTSDSINFLAGYPLGGPTFKSKQEFIKGGVDGPALPGLATTKVFHDCTNISWQWRVTGLGSGTYPVKGVNSFVANPKTGKLLSTDVEFNSIAWGINTGWTCSPPKSSRV